MFWSAKKYQNMSFVWCFGFDVAHWVGVGGHVIVLRVGCDTIHQIIRELELALAGLVGAGGF